MKVMILLTMNAQSAKDFPNIQPSIFKLYLNNLWKESFYVLRFLGSSYVYISDSIYHLLSVSNKELTQSGSFISIISGN